MTYEPYVPFSNRKNAITREKDLSEKTGYSKKLNQHKSKIFHIYIARWNVKKHFKHEVSLGKKSGIHQERWGPTFRKSSIDFQDIISAAKCYIADSLGTRMRTMRIIHTSAIHLVKTNQAPKIFVNRCFLGLSGDGDHKTTCKRSLKCFLKI